MSEQVYDLSNNNQLTVPVDLSVDIIQLDSILDLVDIGIDFIIVEPMLLDTNGKTPYQWAVENGYEYDEETFYSQWLTSLNGGSSGGVFTNPTPTDITVGGLVENSIIQGDTWQEIISKIVYQEKFPTIVDPSFDVIVPQGNIFEINDYSKLYFYLRYNFGSITPAYGTNGFRSGSVVKYMMGNTNIPYSSNNQLYWYNPDEVIPVVYEPYTLNLLFSVVRMVGPQPLSNKGNPYLSPYPAGNFQKSVVIYFVLPWYATVESLTEYYKLPLDILSKEYFETNMIGENILGDKQVALFSIYHNTITGIKQYNTLSGVWEWINGTKELSLSTFDISSTTMEINGNTFSYIMYKHNGPTIGNRKLRFYTT